MIETDKIEAAVIETEVLGIDNSSKGKIGLSSEIFGCEVNRDILHTAVINFLANQRQGTHSTKTIGFVRGGGKKPWKQKHTGRARHGSIRSTIWRGGATTFGPHPRDYSYSLNKKFKRLALRTALSSRFNAGDILILDEITSMFSEAGKPSTKKMLQVLKDLGMDNKSVLIVVEGRVGADNDNVVLSARNIIDVDVVQAGNVTTYDVLNHDKIIILKESITVINNRLIKADTQI